METPSAITPGPTAAIHWSPRGLGGSGSSACCQASSPERVSSGVTEGGVKAGDYNSPSTKRAGEGIMRRPITFTAIAVLMVMPLVAGQGSQAANESLWEASRAGD